MNLTSNMETFQANNNEDTLEEEKGERTYTAKCKYLLKVLVIKIL